MIILSLATALAIVQAPATLSAESAREASEAIRREMEGPVRRALRDRCGRAARCGRFLPRARGGRVPSVPLSMLLCVRAEVGITRCVIWVGMGARRRPIYCTADFREVAGPARWTDRTRGASTLGCSRNLIEATI